MSDNFEYVPDIFELRERIETINKKDIRMCIKYLYLISGRASEAVGKSSRKDIGTNPRGPMARSLSFQDYEGEEAAVFNVKTAKRKGRERICALPLATEYEPWAREVSDYFGEFDSRELVFPFTRQRLSRHSKECWKDLWYKIEPYNIVNLDSEGKTIIGENGKRQTTPVDVHMRTLTVHAVRHFRASDLTGFYGFDGKDLSAFCGWLLSTAMGISSSVDRYVQLNWRSYFPKLLKKRFG